MNEENNLEEVVVNPVSRRDNPVEIHLRAGNVINNNNPGFDLVLVFGGGAEQLIHTDNSLNFYEERDCRAYYQEAIERNEARQHAVDVENGFIGDAGQHEA